MVVACEQAQRSSMWPQRHACAPNQQLHMHRFAHPYLSTAFNFWTVYGSSLSSPDASRHAVMLSCSHHQHTDCECNGECGRGSSRICEQDCNGQHAHARTSLGMQCHARAEMCDACMHAVQVVQAPFNCMSLDHLHSALRASTTLMASSCTVVAHRRQQRSAGLSAAHSSRWLPWLDVPPAWSFDPPAHSIKCARSCTA